MGSGGVIMFPVDVDKGDAGEGGAGVHVDQIVTGEKLFDLAEGEPAEFVVEGDVLCDLDDQVTVAFAEEACALFRLELVH